jgi:phosphatidate cytidylyltransferase
MAENGEHRRPRASRLSASQTRAELQSQIETRRAELHAQVKATREHFDEAQERINKRSGRNLLFAVVFGVILALSMLASLLFIKQLFLVVVVVLITFATTELASALRHAGRDVPRIPSVIAAILVMPLAYLFTGSGQFWGLLGAIVFVSAWRLVESVTTARGASRGDLVRDLGAGAFIQLYITLLASCAVALTAHPEGRWWTITFLAIVVFVDVGAYVSGLNFGKHPMAPRISPKKTWEGFVGSAVFAVAAGIPAAIFLLHEPWYFGVLLALILVGSATIGDLTESLIKRDLGIKDISSWLPGHGGFLDRLDSILPSAAVAYALYLIFA